MRWRAAGALAAIIALLPTLNALNVANSYVGRDFITALAQRDRGQYFRFAVLYMGIFAASAVTGGPHGMPLIAANPAP
jgi:putative ATP-binding cassette transporter